MGREPNIINLHAAGNRDMTWTHAAFQHDVKVMLPIFFSYYDYFLLNCSFFLGGGGEEIGNFKLTSPHPAINNVHTDNSDKVSNEE